MGYISQENFFFNGTIRENLLVWDSSFTDEAIYSALKEACALDVILSKKEGLDALLTEGAANISGGQRQRLEVARTLLYKTPVLILDDATSALDPELEEKVSENIYRRNITTITVTHKIQNMPLFDHICLFHNGEIVAQGTHLELMEFEGYRDPFNAVTKVRK